MTPALLTPGEVAAQYRVSPATVIGWIKAGRLPAIKVNTSEKRPRYRVRPESLEGFNQMAGEQPHRFQAAETWF
jgi:excisionase family DNA binding protein